MSNSYVALTQMRRDALTALVASERGGEAHGMVQAGQPDGDVGRASADVLDVSPCGLTDDVDQSLADDEDSRLGHREPCCLVGLVLMADARVALELASSRWLRS